MDTRATNNRLQTAAATHTATAGVLEQAHRAVAIAQLRYREGISTQLEVRDAQLQLDQAEVNRAVAARDLQITRARVVLLPSLPAATATPSGSALTPATTRQSSTAKTRTPTAANAQNATGATGTTGGGALAPAGTPGRRVRHCL